MGTTKLRRPARVRYFTYFLEFPDGDVWVRQKAFVHDMEWECTQLLKEHKKDSEWKDRARDLFKKGETWWKDELNVEHRIKIEEKKRPEKWGVARAGLGSHGGINQ